jgi:hypothetical protein
VAVAWLEVSRASVKGCDAKACEPERGVRSIITTAPAESSEGHNNDSFTTCHHADGICASDTSAERDHDIETFLARDPGTQRWISYEILGPRNHPFPIIYLSTQSFKPTWDEFPVVVQPARYDMLAAYTRARIARPDCPGKWPVGNVWYAVQVIERDEEYVGNCVLPQALACNYLSGVVNLPGINWTASELRPITLFMSNVRCDSVGTRK